MLREKSVSEYLNLLNDTFLVKSVPDDLVEIFKYGWDRIYTTNYDNSMEIAARQAGKPARPIIPTDDHATQPKNNLQIVHLHGYIERFTTENVGRDCILDYSSNVANAVYSGPWADLLRNDISTSDVVVFIGYSLYDPEIAKLIKSADYSKGKIFFINSSHANEELEYTQKKYGSPKGIEREGFSRILNSATKSAGKTARKSFVCFERAPIVDDPKWSQIGQSDLADLFLFGSFEWRMGQATFDAGRQSYIVQRDLIAKVASKIESGSDFISIFSSLGQGKTVFAHSLATYLSAKGKVAFIAKRNQPEFISELEEIVETYHRPIMIFDDLFRYTKHWDRIAVLGGDKLIVVGTSRLNVYFSRESDITEKFFRHSPESMRLGELTVEEGRALVPLITQANLWGKDAGASDPEKLNRIRGKADVGYQNNFADLLIGLMQSSDIVARFQKELAILKDMAPNCYEGVLLIIYLEFSNNVPDATLLQEGFGSDLREYLSNDETAELLRTFLINDGRGVKYRSSVFSKYALENACNPDDVIRVLRDTVSRLAKSSSLSNDYATVMVDLMRFNYLKSLCRDGNFDRTFEFYNTLSAIPQITRDDLFWNAFGMCERARHHYKEARAHFNTSVSTARNRGPNYVPYHAQNQLIVCILEAGLASDLTAAVAHRDLLEVFRLLMIQADDERSTGTGQAFSWYRQLGEYIDKYVAAFEENQQKSMRVATLRYLQFIHNKVVNWQNRTAPARMSNELTRFI